METSVFKSFDIFFDIFPANQFCTGVNCTRNHTVTTNNSMESKTCDSIFNIFLGKMYKM